VEKPLRPESKLAIMPVYLFDSNIFKAWKLPRQGTRASYN
jgi:dTDP-glucose pyrophosphorylase